MLDSICQDYGFLSLAENMGKNISKKFNGKCNQKDSAYELKNTSKRVI